VADRSLVRALAGLRRAASKGPAASSPEAAPTLFSMTRGITERVTAGPGSLVRQTRIVESVQLLVGDAASSGRSGAPRKARALPASSRGRGSRGVPARALLGVGGAALGLLTSRRALSGLPAGGRPKHLAKRPPQALPRG
jgi:hypothetical protein